MIRRLALFLAVTLGAGSAATAAYGTDGLPPEIAARIDAARERSIGAPGVTPAPNAWLNAAVIETLAAHPELAAPLLERAAAGAEPAVREGLYAEVAYFFPGLLGEGLARTGTAPEGVGASSEAASRAARAGVPPPERRPPSWPILPEEGGADGYAGIDPLRPLNTVFFYFNGTLDFLVFAPVARLYGFLMPEAAKPHIRGAFGNLSSPVVFGNDLLQGEFARAGETLARALINSTFGLAGLFDVAAEWGVPPHRTDFGQTLESYGVGPGIYIVLPLFGPSNARDALGIPVGGAMDPKNYLLDSFERIGLALGEGIVVREDVLDETDFITDYADNHYEAVRAWSWQQRQIELGEDCETPLDLGVCPVSP